MCRCVHARYGPCPFIAITVTAATCSLVAAAHELEYEVQNGMQTRFVRSMIRECSAAFTTQTRSQNSKAATTVHPCTRHRHRYFSISLVAVHKLLPFCQYTHGALRILRMRTVFPGVWGELLICSLICLQHRSMICVPLFTHNVLPPGMDNGYTFVRCGLHPHHL